MKHGKKLTRKQKELLSKNNYDCKEWLLERQDKNSYIYIKRNSKEILSLSFK